MKTRVENKEKLLSIISANRILIRNYGVSTLGVFGSFVRNEQSEQSDVDLLVDFSPEKETYRNFIGLAYYLEELLGRRVEIVTRKGLSPYIGPHILKEVEYVSL
jgi:predicted nucleotidyltransferase